MITSQESKTYRRVVTGQERRFLFPPNSHISLVLKLRGQISEKGLKDAVEKMLVTYPQFRVRMEWNEDGVQWSTTEGAAEVPVKLYARKSDNSWLEALNIEHAIPLKPSTGPLTRFILVKGLEISELIIFCHHAISDGRSLELALKEVLLHLGDPTLEPRPLVDFPAQTLATMPERAALGGFKSWMVGRINKKWKKEKVLFDEEDLENIWKAFWKNTCYEVESIDFDTDETRRLLDASRANGVTLNSTILIALLKVRLEVIGPYDGKARIGTAVDSRKRLRIDCSDGVGFYAGGSFLEVDYKQGKSFWENVSNYHKEVGKKLKDNKIFDTVVSHHYLDQTLVDAMLFSYMGSLVEPHQSRYEKLKDYADNPGEMVPKFLARMGGRAPNIMGTNLGILGIPEQVPGIQVERVFFTPSSGLEMEIVLGVATVGGKLTITLNFYKGYGNKEQIKKIRDAASEFFRSIMKGKTRTIV